MKLKIAPNDAQSMSQDGDAILRSLQNKSLPIVDLMVRESLQNSLDATLPNSETTKVNFSINKFKSEELAKYLEFVTDVLETEYPGEHTVISISDKNTFGLTGDYKSNSLSVLDESNFQKLVFGIGKNQDQEGAGGSWGLGKTSYFRMGIGLVFYYTRILIGNDYEERLIASLIESPKQSDRLLTKSERGIAWWGEFDSTKEKIYPITDSEKIQEILSVFELNNYTGNETGTTIIIPYIKPNEKVEENSEFYPWETSLDKAITMAVQRWYSPRIWNDKYSEKLNNSQLDCSVNNIGINPLMNMEPVFKLFRELYTSALLGKSENSKIKVEEIIFKQNIIENKKEPVGYIAFCEVSREEMRMVAPDNKPSPLAYLGCKDKSKIAKNISKVIAYSRKPGMIVEYSIDGQWTPNNLVQQEDCMLFGFFVPNSNGQLLPKFKELGYFSLESYLRATENADHAKWEDEDGIGIIKRMKSYSIKAINEFYQGQSLDENTTATSALSRKFGSLLMPPRNFGKSSAKEKNPNKQKRNVSSRNRISDITILDSNPIDDKNVEISFKAFIKKESKSIVSVQLLTQDQKMNKELWVKSMGQQMKFPFSIKKIFLNKIDGEKIENVIDGSIDSEISVYIDESNSDCFTIKSDFPLGLELEGVFYMEIESNQYIPNIVIRSEDNEEKDEK